MTGDCKRSDVQPVVPLLIYMHICLPSSQAKKTTKKKTVFMETVARCPSDTSFGAETRTAPWGKQNEGRKTK